MFALIKETPRKAASGVKANLCQGFHFRTFKRHQRERERKRERERERERENKRQEEAGTERGRDEGREKQESPCLTEMSQERITNTGSGSLIAGKMFVKRWCNGRENFLDFFQKRCAFAPAALLTWNALFCPSLAHLF